MPAERKNSHRKQDGALFAVVGVDVLDGLDEWLERLNAASTGPRWSRQALLRAVLMERIATLGKRGKAPPALRAA